MELFWLQRWQQQLLAILRVAVGLLFLEHATMKFFQFPIPVPGSTYPLSSLAMAAGTIELLASLLVIFGLFTRPAAFIASGEMAVGYFLIHFPRGFWPATNAGESAILFCFIFLYLAAAGPGSWSLDAERSGNRFGAARRHRSK
jgi:putative oxidoreductase